MDNIISGILGSGAAPELVSCISGALVILLTVVVIEIVRDIFRQFWR